MVKRLSEQVLEVPCNNRHRAAIASLLYVGNELSVHEFATKLGCKRANALAFFAVMVQNGAAKGYLAVFHQGCEVRGDVRKLDEGFVRGDWTCEGCGEVFTASQAQHEAFVVVTEEADVEW